MIRDILHLVVHVQAGYVKNTYAELSVTINQFAFQLHQYGVPTIWGAAAESDPPLFPASEPAGIRLFLPDDQLVFKPNQGDMVCLNVGSSVASNPYLREYLQTLNNPLIVVSGLYASYCVAASLSGLISAGYECYVPLELIADPKKDYGGKSYNLPLICKRNQ